MGKADTAKVGDRSWHHETVPVSVGDRSAQIDAQLASIIESLWRLGITTRGCCQNESETLSRPVSVQRGYIGFELVDDLQRFLELLSGTELADHRWQNFEWADEVGGEVVEVAPIGWTYKINVRRPGPKRPAIEIGASVRFPVTDISLMDATLKALVEEQTGFQTAAS